MSKELIKKAALNLFNDKGYEAASIRDITKQVGISVSTFYAHFDSKEELFCLLLQESLDHLHEYLADYMAEVADQPTLDQLYEYVYSRLKYYHVNKDEYLFAIRYVVFPPNSIKEKTREYQNIWDENILSVSSEILLKAQEEGSLQNCPVEVLTRSILRLISGYCVQIILYNESPEVSKETSKEAWELYLNGIRSLK